MFTNKPLQYTYVAFFAIIALAITGGVLMHSSLREEINRKAVEHGEAFRKLKEDNERMERKFETLLNAKLKEDNEAIERKFETQLNANKDNLIAEIKKLHLLNKGTLDTELVSLNNKLTPVSRQVSSHAKIKREVLKEITIIGLNNSLIANIKNKSYTFPVWPTGKGPPTPSKAHKQLVLGEDGKPRQFGEEILVVLLVPTDRFDNLQHFWNIKANPNESNKAEIELDAVAFHQEATVRFDIFVEYREK